MAAGSFNCSFIVINMYVVAQGGGVLSVGTEVDAVLNLGYGIPIIEFVADT